MQRRTLITIAAAAVGATTVAGARPAAAAPDVPEAPIGRVPRVDGVRTNTALTRAFGKYGDTCGAWIGADSGYSVPMADGRTVWIWSDTFVGDVGPDHTIDRDAAFIHNSLIVQDPDGTLTTIHGGSTEEPASLFAVPGGSENTEWFWCADATLEGTDLVMCLLHFVKTGDDVFDFEFRGTAIGTVSTDDFTVRHLQQRTTRIHWGSALFEDGGWTYVYGVDDQRDDKFLHLARVPRGSLREWDSWRYWTGSTWSSDEADSVSLMTGVANEFSVTRSPAGLMLLTQDTSTPLSPDIVAYAARRPTGPFTGKTLVYRTPETEGNVFTYNAKAHGRRGDGPVLVTYNVNSFDPEDLYADARLYRPRFLDADLAIAAEVQ